MHISINGSYSVGKSTICRKIEQEYPELFHTPDLAREWLERHGKSSQDLTDKERVELQQWVAASYVGNMKHADINKRTNIMDGSLVEVIAYSTGVLSDHFLQSIKNILHKHDGEMVALVIPPTIHLENDGLRHTDAEFRIVIHERIMSLIQQFNIPYKFIVVQTVEERTEEVRKVIRELHG